MWNDIQDELRDEPLDLPLLAAIMICRCVGLFDRYYHNHRRQDLKLFEQFERTAGRNTREADRLERKFVDGFDRVAGWLKNKEVRPSDLIVVPRQDGMNEEISSLHHPNDDFHYSEIDTRSSLANRFIDISTETRLEFESHSMDAELHTLLIVLRTSNDILDSIIKSIQHISC